ncbi:FecCD family ABC transporter permease [Mangrovibacterium diazotrophicum]|uniref:Iron complex transport system permease protein n=1 Tax=Mangrovibacterium diazotrophicum TaxID=1261403 RepID=A0A419W4P5_9BACT|nr:iron ABC transporter permease [Mangrovibacterium diazotrophicum]RKD90400.1 iron complex transport system permease protein [Mangrovibacterium diazotrophicum]
MSSKSRKLYTFILLPLFCLAVAVTSLFLGRFPLAWNDFAQLLRSFFDPDAVVSPQAATIILHIRLPRILAAFLIGGTLSLTGAAYQGLFRNPMVSPSILGVSSAAGFGAALAILMALSSFWVQTFSFLSGVGAIVIVYLISLSTGRGHNKYLTLILSGMVVGAIFTALVSLLKYIADPYDTLPSIVYWLMGGLAGIELSELKFLAVVALCGGFILTISGWKLDLLSFGDDEARSMGVHVEYLRFLVIVVATLMTAAAVCLSGIIGWIGLLVPHISRMLIGPKNSYLLPASFFSGGAFLMLVDDFSRTVTSMEIPLGITTSLIGAPFFIFILLKTSKK